MIKIKNKLQNEPTAMTKYLSPIAVWALAFGCSVGWGAFIMPGTTFLPIAGPMGSVIGLLIGAAIMVVIGVNYSRLIHRYRSPGGAYIFAKRVLGGDHGFLCAWTLLLTYIAIIWANATALSLIVRYLFGDIFCFGFSYQIAGYTVYLGEVLLSVALIAATCIICIISKNLAKWVQLIGAVILFCGISACFIFVLIRNGGFSNLNPLFNQNSSPAVQIIGIVILAPWAFVGFESISHSSSEFKFHAKKTFPIIIVALIASALAYIMLTLCASMAHPDGYSGWSDYIASLANAEGYQSIPTFYSAQQAMGNSGLVLLGISALCGIITGMIGHMIAISRLIISMSSDDMLPRPLRLQNKQGTPWLAVCCVGVISCFIPFLGRTAISWIVDVTTIGAVILYAYVSICAFVSGKRLKSRFQMIFGITGTVFSLIFAAIYLLPDISPRSKLSTESFLILIVWSVLGMVVFRLIIKRDKTRSFGKSEAAWVIPLFLILIVSVSWINRTTNEETDVLAGEVKSVSIEQVIQNNGDNVTNPEQTEKKLTNKITDFRHMIVRNITIQDALLFCAIAVIFSIFSVIKKREKYIEAERMRAEEKSRAKSIFLSNMSHDIRTPMNAVTGYTALALKEENLPDNVREYLEKIDYSGKQLLALINDILDMSRIESGKVELNAAPSDLVEILDEVAGLFAIQMKSKGLEYTVDCSGIKDRYVICDRNRLNRILLNLISNALKFTPGGGKVTVVMEQHGKEGDQGVYELTVADTGIGMSPEFSKHIFDAFERERTQTVSKLQGTGLGMTIAKNLVDLMHGSITVETEQHKGTKYTIVVRFPITTKDELEPEPPLPEGDKEIKGKRLLVVEDNPINNEIACTILQQEGYITDTVENGREALETIERSEPLAYAAVLMDIQMPEMNGYDASRAIRALKGERGNVPIIAITANSFESDRQKAFDAGMNAHVAKPFVPEELLNTIQRYSRSSRIGNENSTKE